MTKMVLLNSPQSCGKTEAVKYMLKKGLPLVTRECKAALHQLTVMFFKVPEEQYWEIYKDGVMKNTPLPEFKVEFANLEEAYELQTLLGYNFSDTLKGRETYLPKGFNPLTINLSCREAMIYISEIIVKPRFGDDWFGVTRACTIQDGEIAIDDSCGFEQELPPLIENLGQENILLIRIHRDGFTFDGDSRNWIPDGVIENTIDVYNDKSEQEFLDKMYNLVTNFIGETRGQ